MEWKDLQQLAAAALGGGGFVALISLIKFVLKQKSDDRQGEHTRRRENRQDSNTELREVIEHFKTEIERMEKKLDDEREECNEKLRVQKDDYTAKIREINEKHGAQIEQIRADGETNKARIFILDRDNKRLQTLLRGTQDIHKLPPDELRVAVKEAEDTQRQEQEWPTPPPETEWMDDEGTAAG